MKYDYKKIVITFYSKKGCVILRKIRFAIRGIVFMLFVLFLLNVPCYANSAEPPSILIIVPNAPNDLEISISSEDKIHKPRETSKLIENYYAFYTSQMRELNNYTLIVNTGEETFEIKLDKPLKNYNNIFTLDLKKHTLTNGRLKSRSAFLVLMRILLTLAIEAIIFLAFRFKDKKSWIAFLIINLVTQGILNIWLNGFMPMQSYIIFGLIFGEIFVFIAEIIAFLMLCKEHSRLRKVLYVLTANFISLIAGGYIITILPI